MNSKIKSILCRIAYSRVGNALVTSLGIKRLWVEMHVRVAKKRLLDEAKKEFEKGNACGSLEDYKRALNKHWVSYREYAFQYKFPDKSEDERNEYVSRLKMAYFYWRFAPGAAKAVFRNKPIFLQVFNKNVHRKWLYAPEASFDAFKQIICDFDCILKPCDGKLGKGITKVFKEERKDAEELYAFCKKNRVLVEECVESCAELKALHPESLNTIRIVTVANKQKTCVLSGVLRTGIGKSVVDNSHAGGVSAQINIQNGIVETDGANTEGKTFIYHPDSGIQFKGFKIPQWKTIVDAVCEAAKNSGNPITGWDIVLDKEGNVEFIEGNYGPDMDMMQARYHKGYKKQIYALINEYCGIKLKE